MCKDTQKCNNNERKPQDYSFLAEGHFPEQTHSALICTFTYCIGKVIYTASEDEDILQMGMKIYCVEGMNSPIKTL